MNHIFYMIYTFTKSFAAIEPDINIFIQESSNIQQREFNNENQFYCFNILRSSNILKMTYI